MLKLDEKISLTDGFYYSR